ncbi:hypothetical protein Tco_1402363 [Tanacetum coccineum]
MSTLTIADTHNMICYALTVNPTIYTSCIQHIWATAKAKMVNGEVLIACPTATILRMDGWIYVNPSHTKKIFANMKREENDFSRRITPLFETITVQPTQDEGVDLGIPADSLQTPIPTQPSSSRAQKKQSKRKQGKDTTVTQEEPQQDDSVPTLSNDPLSVRLEKKKKSRATGLKRLKKVGMSRRVEFFEDQESLGDHEDASKQGDRS